MADYELIGLNEAGPDLRAPTAADTGTVAGDVNVTGTVTAATYTGALASAVTATTQPVSDNSTKVATTAYVDASSAAHDSLEEVLVVGNTTGGTDIVVTSGDVLTTNTINETTAASGVTIDSVLLKDNTITATTYTGALASAVTATTQAASDNSTKVATTAYVDTSSAAHDSLEEVLVVGNTSGTNNLIIDSGQVLTTNTINETTAASGVTIDSVLIKDNTVTATTYSGALASTVTATTQAASDNSTKVATTAYVDTSSAAHDSLPEVLVVGNTTGGTDLAVSAGDDITFTDTSKAIFGAGSDLQIYHDGYHSNIKETGAGSLLFDAANIIFRNADASKSYAALYDGGAVDLYYNNALKLSTTSTGIDVTGTATMDGLVSSGNAKIGAGVASNSTVLMVNTASGSSAGIQLFQDGLESWIIQNPASTTALTFANSNTDRLKIASNGDVSFYEPTGTTPKFFWDASTENLGIGTSSPVEKLYVNSTSGDARIGLNAPTGSDTEIKFNNNGVVQFSIGHDDGTDNFVIGADNVDAPYVSVTKAGNVGIGTDAPNSYANFSTLTINGTTGSEVDLEAGGTLRGALYATSTAVGLQTSSATNLPLLFGTNGVERMRITSAGVGIGTSTPATALDVSSTTTATLRLSNSDTVLTEGQITGQVEFYQVDATTGGTGITGKIGMRSVPSLGGSYYGNAADMDFYVSGQANGYASDNATLKALTIQAGSGNVGIGTATPATALDVAGTVTVSAEVNVGAYSPQTAANLTTRINGTAIEFGHGNVTSGYYGTLGTLYNNGMPYLAFSADADATGDSFTTRGFKGNVLQGTASGDLTFNQLTTASASGQTLTERMRITSAGDFLLGKTAASSATEGFEAKPSGFFAATRTNNVVGVLNRLSTDGDILDFRKAGTSVGSIGVDNGDNLFIEGSAGSTHSGLQFGTSAVLPHKNGIAANAVVDLGAAASQFKDLYLSGTVTSAGLVSKTLGLNNFVAGSTAGDSILAGGNNNTLVGDLAGTAITTGDDNVAVGYAALDAASSGKFNTAVGKSAGGAVTTGIQNTLIGGVAGDALTDADYNVAVGYLALSQDTLGSRSVAIGYGSLTTQNFISATNSYNVAVGHNAGNKLTTGTQNTFIGGLAGNANTTANNNTAVGYNSLDANTTGAANVALGTNALDANTTASNNTAIGYASLGANTTGTANVAVGWAALVANITSNSSTAVGYQALVVSTGALNTALGRDAGSAVTTGSNLTLIGHNAQPSSATATNEMTFGDTNVTLNRFNGDVTLSDGDLIVSDGFMNYGGGDAVTIVSGAVTVTETNTVIAGEGAASDTLNTINGGTSGDLLIISTASNGQNLTVVDDGGNIRLNGTNCELFNVYDKLTLIASGSDWHELSRSINGTP